MVTLPYDFRETITSHVHLAEWLRDVRRLQLHPAPPLLGMRYGTPALPQHAWLVVTHIPALDLILLICTAQFL